MEKRKKTRAAFFAALGVYTIWGFTFFASKTAQNYATPFILLAWRFDAATLLLSLPVIVGKKEMRLQGKSIFPLILLGLMEPCLYFIGEQYGIRLTNSAFSGIMIAVIPIVTIILAAAFLKDKPSAKQWLFSILSILGIIVITISENSGGEIHPAGVLCLVAAIVCGASYTVISKKIGEDFSVFERTFFMELMGGIFFTVLAIIENINDPAAIFAPILYPDFLAAVVYLSVFASVVGYLLFNYAVSNAPTAKVVVLCNLTTVISVLAGVILLKEPFPPVAGAAMLAVLVGIWGVQKF